MNEKGKNNIPTHVAIIMDGNGRWAQKRGEERSFGHIQGVESVRNVIKASREAGVRYLTLYVFSTENRGRPKEEVQMLMELFCKSVVNETAELKAQGVCVRIIGNREEIAPEVRTHLEKIENETAGNSTLTLSLAFNYGSREEIVQTVRHIVDRICQGALSPENIDADTISANLYTHGIPDPDLIIRTGGDCRLSNFLLWQSAYSELYFTPTYWPDFGRDDFMKALQAYAGRERRYGLLTNTKKQED